MLFHKYFQNTTVGYRKYIGSLRHQGLYINRYILKGTLLPVLKEKLLRFRKRDRTFFRKNDWPKRAYEFLHVFDSESNVWVCPIARRAEREHNIKPLPKRPRPLTRFHFRPRLKKSIYQQQWRQRKT